MKVTKYNVTDTFYGEGGDKLTVRYDNMGEPYREGASFEFEEGNGMNHVNCFLTTREVTQLRDRLTKLLEKMTR